MIWDTLRDTSFSFGSCWYWRPRYTMTLDVLVLEKRHVLRKTPLDLIYSVNDRIPPSLNSSVFNLSWWPSGGGVHVPATRWGHVIRTHFWKQWAAVRTHWLLIRVPPQAWLPLLYRLACQGQAPAGASTPPTILVLSGAVPQTGPKWQRIRVSLRISA